MLAACNTVSKKRVLGVVVRSSTIVISCHSRGIVNSKQKVCVLDGTLVATNVNNVPSKLIAFGFEQIHNAITKKECFPKESIDIIVSNIVSNFKSKSSILNIHHRSNQHFHEHVSMVVSAVHHLAVEELLNFINTSTLEVSTDLMIEYNVNVRAKRQSVYFDIIKQHSTLRSSDWGDMSNAVGRLQKYSSAAETMGEKLWVQKGNEWIRGYATSFFRTGGAVRHHVKVATKRFKLANEGAEMPRDEFDSLKNLTRDLMATDPAAGHNNVRSNRLNGDWLNDSSAHKIRLLDVGSCYNPIAAEDSGALFAVTALDLYPAHSSVLQCDFLNLQVGPEGSESVITLPNSTEKLPSLCGTSQSATTLDESGMSKLVQLPAGSFDAVAMSLVLNYLPSPAHREAMVAKARQLLVGPGHSGRPHHSGLLLIVEKQSIFGAERQSNSQTSSERVRLLQSWKQTICNLGFELVSHSTLRCGDKVNPVFAFAAVEVPVTQSLAENGETPSMWIRQDFEHADVSTPTNDDCERETLPVGIVGGGLGGCALALALQRKGIPALVFEKDSHFSTRKQGYALTMQQAGTPLKDLGLGKALAASGVVSWAHYSYNKSGVQIGAYGRDLLQQSSTTHDESDELRCGAAGRVGQKVGRNKSRINIHIPRQKLRDLLLTELNPESVQWGKQLVRFTQVAKEKRVSHVVLHFSDGSEYKVGALVGADGIHSTVRRLMVDPEKDTPLKYLGLMVILGISNMPSVNRVLLEETMGKDHQVLPAGEWQPSEPYCQTQWLDGETRVFSMPFDGQRTMWQLSYPLDEQRAKDLGANLVAQHDFDNSESDSGNYGKLNCDAQLGHKLKADALSRCRGWTRALVNLIERTDETMVSGHPVYDRDPPSPDLFTQHTRHIMETDSSESSDDEDLMGKSLVTLIGDAAHPMSPFKGQGANQALLDASAVSRVLLGSALGRLAGRPAAVALRDYERAMCARSVSKVMQSRDAAVYLHSEAALAEGNITRARAAKEFFAAEKNRTP